jgi:hypothetical protein
MKFLEKKNRILTSPTACIGKMALILKVFSIFMLSKWISVFFGSGIGFLLFRLTAGSVIFFLLFCDSPRFAYLFCSLEQYFSYI